MFKTFVELTQTFATEYVLSFTSTPSHYGVYVQE